MGSWKNNKGYGWMLGSLVGIGAAQGQFTVIWKKAVMICLECIGLG